MEFTLLIQNKLKVFHSYNRYENAKSVWIKQLKFETEFFGVIFRLFEVSFSKPKIQKPK